MNTQRQDMYASEYHGRPCGVVFMATFLFLEGIFLLISGFLGLIGLVVLFFDLSTGGALLFHGVISFALGILSIIFAVGMYSMQRWAYWAVLLVAFFNLLTSLTILISTGFASWGQLFPLAFSLVILIYFTQNAQVRAAFRPPSARI